MAGSRTYLLVQKKSIPYIIESVQVESRGGRWTLRQGFSMDTPSTTRAVLVCASLHLRAPEERGGECREGGSVYAAELARSTGGV
jgi:hypothetical protein